MSDKPKSLRKAIDAGAERIGEDIGVSLPATPLEAVGRFLPGNDD